MADLTAGIVLGRVPGALTRASLVAAAGAAWWAGQLAFVDRAGLVVPCLGDGDDFAGIVVRDQTLPAGAPVEVWVAGAFLFPVGWAGRVLRAASNNPADVSPDAAGPAVGRGHGFSGGALVVVLA